MRAEKQFLIDTNFILRLLIGDVPTQLERSRKLFKKIEEKEAVGLISILVINELIWILEHFYHQKRQDFIPLVLKLLSLKNIKMLEIKKKELISVLEKMEKTNFDFTDLYLLYFGEKLQYRVASFDRKLLKAEFQSG